MAEDNAEDEEVSDRKGRIIIIAGPTGVGKTRLPLALAKCLGGEIISADCVPISSSFASTTNIAPPHRTLSVLTSVTGRGCGFGVNYLRFRSFLFSI